MYYKTKSYILIFLLSVISVSGFTVATWNTKNNPDNETEDAVYKIVIPMLKNPMVMGINETDSGSSIRFKNLLNQHYTNSNYKLIVSSSVGGDRNAILYDSNKTELLESKEIKYNDLTRPIIRGHFRPKNTNGNSDFYFYTVHLKSGSNTEAKTIRETECLIIKNEIMSVSNPHIILAGDLNMQNSYEPGWNIISSVLNDLAHAEGNWKDNEEFIKFHSQNPESSMDDRFDLILGSSKLEDTLNLEYTHNSYTVIGNNGTHTLNSTLNTGTAASVDKLTALMQASDHLPVIAEFHYLPNIKLSNKYNNTITMLLEGINNTKYTILESKDLKNWKHNRTLVAYQNNISIDMPITGNKCFWKINIE